MSKAVMRVSEVFTTTRPWPTSGGTSVSAESVARQMNFALGVVDLDFAAVRYDGLMHAVRADACDDAGAGFGFPDLVARMAVKAVEAAAARGVDGIVRHGRREIAVAFADGKPSRRPSG